MWVNAVELKFYWTKQKHILYFIITRVVTRVATFKALFA